MAEQKLEVNELALSLAKKYRHKLLETDYTQMQSAEFAREAAASLQKQRELEEADTLSFDDFLRLTFAGCPHVLSPTRSAKGECCQCPALPSHSDASCELF